MPAELRTLLNQARAPDGTRIVNNAEVLRLIASAYGTGERQAVSQGQDRRTMLQTELAEIDALMHRDINEYHQPWRGTGMSASDRRLQIMRELASEAPARPSAVDLRAEQRELERLRDQDPQMFSFGNWRGSGRPAADRLVAIQSGRT
jgi:hypothetical protein